MRHLRRVILGNRCSKGGFPTRARKIEREAHALPKIGRFGLAAVCVLGTIGAWIYWLPLPNELKTSPPGTLTLLDCRGRDVAEIASQEARTQFPVTLEQMGQWLPRVTVALEDRRFYQHQGVDWRATVGTGVRNLRSGRIISGGSTITQQLVKLATHRQARSWRAKIYETIMASKLERRWSKARILTEYLNRSSYGNRRLGPEAAARAYFNKSARDLTFSEAVFLAGLPQAPTRLNPWRHPQDATRKYQRSLARLAALGFVTADEVHLLAQPPQIAHLDFPRRAPHFVDAIVRQNPWLRGTVRTTLDLEMQTMVERLLNSHLAALNRFDITQAAVVVIENESGSIRAMVGSSNYSLAQINGATRPRSCGSTLKPFVYLDAIDKGKLTAASLLPDTPDAIRVEYADYDPQNYNHHYLGPVRLREALGCSLNVPAVFTLSQLGARPTFYQLGKWGFDFPKGLADYGAGFVLGNAETRLVDLAAAYAGLARGGMAMRAKFLAGEHQVIKRIASEEATSIITDILCDNDARQRSFGSHSPLAFEQRIAVKTGTSSGFRDTWTVGFNKEHTVAVWAGNFDGRPMHDTFAVRAASPLWAAIMHELLARDHPLDPPIENEKLVRREICRATGLLPSKSSPAKMNEWFLAGTEPRADSSDYFTTDGTLLLPNEYGYWCASHYNTIGAHARAEARITNPPANAHYELDPVLARSQQMVELMSGLGGEVRWFVNGAPVPPRRDGRVFWPLASGEWNIRAVSRIGTAGETISVSE